MFPNGARISLQRCLLTLPGTSSIENAEVFMSLPIAVHPDGRKCHNFSAARRCGRRAWRKAQSFAGRRMHILGGAFDDRNAVRCIAEAVEQTCG